MLLALLFILFLIPAIGTNGSGGTVASSKNLVGPRFFPYLSVGLMGVIGAVMMIQNRRALEVRTRTRLATKPLKHALAAITIGTVYIVMLPLLGIFVATPLCLAAFFVYFGVRGWGVVVLFSTGITIVIYVIFQELMNVPLSN